MALKKKARIAQEARTSSQTPQRAPQSSQTSTTMRTRGNVPHPLGLANLDHIVVIMPLVNW